VDDLFSDFLEILHEGEGVSTFELLESGVTAALDGFLIGGKYPPTEQHQKAQEDTRILYTRIMNVAKVPTHESS